MKRDLLIAYLRIAGYHEDHATFTRLYIENRISKARADAAFNAGREAKRSGVPCRCGECSPRPAP